MCAEADDGFLFLLSLSLPPWDEFALLTFKGVGDVASGGMVEVPQGVVAGVDDVDVVVSVMCTLNRLKVAAAIRNWKAYRGSGSFSMKIS